MKERLAHLANTFLNVLPHADYYLPMHYKANFFPRSYADTPELSRLYQRDVYRLARTLVKNKHLKTVMDVGCGYGVKLAEFIAPHADDIIGVDMPEAIHYCREVYSFGSWYADDVQSSTLIIDEPVDLIICSDVIEHLPNPDYLFAYFRKFAHAQTWIVLSTPERDKVRGTNHLGPPPNPAHVREWNKKEFAAYARSQGMKILEHTLVKDIAARRKSTPLRKYGTTCQVIVGRLI